jgi:hypothetical protein
VVAVVSGGFSFAPHPIAATARAAQIPTLDSSEGDAVYAVYFPWAGAVLALIDSVVDQAHDATSGTHSLVAQYPSPHMAGERLGALASRALALTSTTKHPERHALIVASMISLFASAPEAQSPQAHEAIRRVVIATGPRARLPLLALRLKRKFDALTGST